MSDEGTEVPDRKEIKVKILEDQHVKLHTVKILKGQTISATLEKALGRYFDRLSEDGGVPGLEEMWKQGPESLT